MEAVLEFYGDKTCPVCGKRFTVIWPHQWAFKRGKSKPKYYCSWKCLRTLDNDKGDEDQVKRGKVTLEQKKRAVQIALDGGDPLRFLQQHGSGNPTGMWYTIKQHLKEADPETYEKLPKRIDRKDAKPKQAPAHTEDPDEPEAHTLADAMTGMENAATEFLNKCEEMGLKVNGKDEIRTPDKAVVGPFAITAIRHKIFGEFYHDVDHNCVDWRTIEGDEMSMKIPAWKNLVKELPEILKMLGVGM